MHQRIGKDADVNPHRIIIAFQNVKSLVPLDSDCENVVMVFPSVKVPNVKNGCGAEKMNAFLNKTNFYNETINLPPGTFKVFNMTNDTFDDEGNFSPSNKIMSITTPFYDLTKPQGALGIMILQYKLRELGKMIDHVSIQRLCKLFIVHGLGSTHLLLLVVTSEHYI